MSPKVKKPSIEEIQALNIENLKQLLCNLKLRRIEEIIEEELSKASSTKPSYSELLSSLFRQQYYYQLERSLENRIKNARIPEKWALETFPFKKQQSINETQIKQLAQLDFIPRAENIVFRGDTGRGKTGLATGILLKAITDGYRGLFIKAQDLFDDMYASIADRSSRSLINRLMRVDLLVIDEMGYLNLAKEQCNMFFKLMEERYNKRSTIITTNLNYDEWHSFLGNKNMVEALLDRLRHHCHTIVIEGESLRAPAC